MIIEDFLFGLLLGGIILLVVVILLCIAVRRIKTRVEELPSTIYDVAFENLEAVNNKRSKSRVKKNVYQNSPISIRPPSTLYRSNSNESITFVPSINDNGKTAETCKENDGITVSDSNKNTVELKSYKYTFKCLLSEAHAGLGTSNEAFASDSSNVHRIPEALHARNSKRPRLNSPCPKRLEETAFERVQLSKSKGIPTKGNSLYNPKSPTEIGNKRSSLPVNCQRSKPVEAGIQPPHSSQETAVAPDFDQVIQDLEKVCENETKSFDPVYTNVGGLALVNNPEIHLLKQESEAGQSHKSSTFNLQHGCDVTKQQSGSPKYNDQIKYQDYNSESVHGDCSGKSRYKVSSDESEYHDQSRFQKNNAEDWYGNCGYQDNNGLHENRGYNGQNEYVYQDHSANNEYQDYNSQSDYVDFTGQKDYEDFSTQSDDQDFNGQNHYQVFSGENENRYYNGENDYQDFSIHNEYHSNYYGNYEICFNESMNRETEEALAHRNDGLQDPMNSEQNDTHL